MSSFLFAIDFSQLEKYSTNLEGVVAERTAELAAEKAKTDELVCRKLTYCKHTLYQEAYRYYRERDQKLQS